ncbi:hypothetical protein HID58_028310 [Brassica napus]|uniref:Uncharacterized protein n=1 Tax=Brassica napus TaxID=3708 RepID=A0ABQ8C9U8_BRANA|nr:hypothetical protein HID58_028310 [Brassica napus]
MCPQSNDGVVTVARRKDTDTAARREDANTTARREDAGTATFWCGGDAATPVERRQTFFIMLVFLY